MRCERHSARCADEELQRVGAVTAAIVRAGKVVEHVALNGEIPRCPDSDFIWIEAHDPHRGDFSILQDRFGLHSLAIADGMRTTQFPKVDLYDDQLFVALKSARLERDAIAYTEISAFVSSRHIISLYHSTAGPRDRTHEELHDLSKLVHATPDFILHSILNFVVRGYFPIVQMVEEDVLAMEQHLQDALLDRAEITRLFRLRREAIHLQHVLTGMSDVCGKLTNLDVPCITAAAKPYFRDVHDQLVRLDGMVRGLVQVISTVFEASILLEIQRQGIITRQLAAWAAILGVPAAIAAVYSMIHADLAGLGAPERIALVVGAMTASCSVLYVRFRKLRWL
jgi:magnesium transporter